MSGPNVTVLMTVRNGEPYLREAVASILNQTYKHFRFLILDNASTDRSREIIRSFHDPRIDLIELPEDVGQTAALNLGLQMVDTPWVARMDADDVSLPSRLELQMAYLRDHPGVILLGTGVSVIDRRGQVLRDFRVWLADEDIRWLHIIGRSGVDHSAAVFATAAVVLAGGYPAQYHYAQDYALWGRLLDLGRVANIPQRLMLWRTHDSNVTNSDAAEQEIRSIQRERLRRLFAEETDETITDVAAALRGLTSDCFLDPWAALCRCLFSLPRRFKAVFGCVPSRALLTEYAYHWLAMARRSSLFSRRRALVWIKLALQLEPALWADSRFWYTVYAIAAARFIHRKTWLTKH